MNKYHNLTEMLAINESAHEFFNSLPDYVREMIISRGNNVRTSEELHSYADKLLRGDD